LVQATGGVHVNVRPLAGKIELVNVQFAELVVPAVVAAQFVVVVLLLNTELEDPLKPTCFVLAVEFLTMVP
jgi:hypothetical protein